MSVAIETYELFPCPLPEQPAASPRLRLVAADQSAEPVGVPAVAAPLRAVPRRPRTEPVALLRAPAGAESAAPVRLTRRGVVAVSLLVALLGGVLVWLATASAPASVAAPAVPATVTVHPGDTLWSIASRYSGSQDPRAVVASIQQRNGLAGVALVPGQVLRLR